MSEVSSTNTTEQDLSALGIVSSYIWKPQKLFIKDTDAYIPVDIVSDGTAEDVRAAVISSGRNQISQIRALTDAQKAVIGEHEQDYTMIKTNLAASYRRMYNYFMSQGLVALATIMATAIVNLNLT